MRQGVIGMRIGRGRGIVLVVAFATVCIAAISTKNEGDFEVDDQLSVGTSSPDAQHVGHFKGRVLAENGADGSGTARNEGVSVWTDEAFGLEIHRSNSSWQTAFYGRRTDTTALTLGAYNSGETQQQQFFHYLTILNSGEVGIGTETPIETLTLYANDATLAIEEHGTSPPNSSSGYAKFYVDDGEMYTLDDSGNDTQISSHADPRDYGEPINTSFQDPSVELPFSFHHKNRFIGKGAVVDLAAMIRDVEALTGNNYTTAYDIPEAPTEELLSRYDWIEIPIGEAWEEVEVMVPERETVYEYDLEEETVYTVQAPTGEPSEEGTGILRRQLKEGVRFEEETGKFYRRPLEAEIPQGATPDLPLWIADRLPE